VLSHRQHFPRAILAVCGETMAYQGQVISVPEMLETLIANGRSDAEAAREIASALEERAILLAYANGHVFEKEDLASVLDCIRDFPTRARTGSLLHATTFRRLADGGAGAWRLQFEIACGLDQRLEAAGPRLTAEEACKAFILRLKEQGTRIPKAQVYSQARIRIPDLVEKEFDRAWREVAGDWRSPGALRKGENKPPQ
jgi:hypothetical protein